MQVFLIHSANEVGFILAEEISGDIESFSELMNKKAFEIGCKNTNFTNPSGLHDINHHTTAYDLALIANYCMKNQTFRNIVSMPSCTINQTNMHDKRYYSNTNKLILQSSNYYDKNVIGIKTGFTDEAGDCLISAYSKDNRELISVILDAPQSTDARFSDTLKICKYGIENFEVKTIAEKNSIITSVEIFNAKDDSKNLDLLLSKDINVLVSKDFDLNNLNYTIDLNKIIIAPLPKNKVVGTVTFKIDNIDYTADLITSHDVELSILWQEIYIAIFTCILIIGLLIWIFSLTRK